MAFTMQVSRVLFLTTCAVSLSACLSGGFKKEQGFYAPPPPPVAAAPMPGAQMGSKGSIYQASQGYAPLVVGNRARTLGDMLTIALVESTSTSKSTTSSTDRDGSIGLVPPTAGPLSFLNPSSIASNGQTSFAGSGSAAQQSQLNGMVSVTISAIYPNGTAEVVGEKQMVLSQGDEWIQFAGRIRLVDITSDNTIPSSRVANARIIYSGKGAVQQASRPGWLQRFFSAITPF